MKRNFKFYVAVSFVVTLMSAPAFGAEEPAPAAPATPAAPKPKDLTLAEIKKLGLSFKAKDVSPDNNQTSAWTVKLIGKMSSTCLEKFSILNSQMNPEAFDGRAMTFRIQDLGGGMACREAELKTGKGCAGNNCVDLAGDPRARMDLADEGDGDVKVLQINDNLSVDDDGYANEEPVSKLFGSVPQHISKKTLERRAKERAEKERQEQIDLLTSTISSCRKTPQELPVARKAAKALFDIDGDRASFKRVLRELDDVEVKLLVAQAETVPLKDVESLRQDLLDHLNDMNAEQIGRGLEVLAARVVNQKDKSGKKIAPSLEDYRLARDILGDAMGLPGLSAKSQNVLQKESDANETAYFSSYGLAVAKSNDPFAKATFWQEYRSKVTEMSQRRKEACEGESRNQDDCSIAWAAERKMAELPTNVDNVYRQQLQEEQRMNQEIAQRMNGQNGQPQQGQQQAQGPQMPVSNPMPLSGGQQQSSWVPYQQNQMGFNAGFNGNSSSMMGSPMMSSGSGYWSGGQFGGGMRPSTF